MKIMRKWEWVACQCIKLGYSKAMALAVEIDELLQELYGNEHTYFWRVNYDRFSKWQDKQGLINIASMPSSCVACAAERDCQLCAFGKKAGICHNLESLYDRVFDAIYLEE